jgi:transketolase
MKTRQHYIQKAREAAWITNHLIDADKKLSSGIDALQMQGAKERREWRTKWDNWEKANPGEAAMAKKQLEKLELENLFRTDTTIELEKRM